MARGPRPRLRGLGFCDGNGDRECPARYQSQSASSRLQADPSTALRTGFAAPAGARCRDSYARCLWASDASPPGPWALHRVLQSPCQAARGRQRPQAASHAR